MAHLVEVAFKGNRKEFFLWDYPDPPPLNAAVIVDVDRGEDLGYVHALGELAQKRNGGCSHGCGTSLPERKALRLATEKDRALSKDLAALNEEARRKAMERVRANALGMKLSDAEWQWDRKKLTLYFTADKRVDFRNLVRDLAAMFRTRIELKQIGVRDEAKRLDGVGRCGRQYCSASWLPELRPVSLVGAKDQHLSLNPSQISGACGRLMCCLRYENEFYVQSRKRFPKEGRILVTLVGEEKVLANDIFTDRVTLRGHKSDTRVGPLDDLRREPDRVAGGIPDGSDALQRQIATDAERDDGVESMDEIVATAVVELPSVPTPLITEPVSTAERDLQPPEGESEPQSDASTDAGTGSEEQRARRRRGRRGGRRGKRTGDRGSTPAEE